LTTVCRCLLVERFITQTSPVANACELRLYPIFQSIHLKHHVEYLRWKDTPAITITWHGLI